MKRSKKRKLDNIVRRWQEGQPMTAAERRQIRKAIKAPKNINGPSKRMTYDDLHPTTEDEK